jgi:hypothetical protein
MTIWKVDLEYFTDFLKAVSKYKCWFYGITITKNIGIGFIVRRPRDE